MLDIIMIILILLAIILLLYGISERSQFFIIMDSLLWFILAALLLQGVEIPYEMYNATSGNIETGVHTIKTNLEPLAYLFMGLGITLFILFVTFTLETLGDYRRIK